MTGVMLVAVAIIVMVIAKGSNRNNGKFLGSSTSMMFGN